MIFLTTRSTSESHRRVPGRSLGLRQSTRFYRDFASIMVASLRAAQLSLLSVLVIQLTTNPPGAEAFQVRKRIQQARPVTIDSSQRMSLPAPMHHLTCEEEAEVPTPALTPPLWVRPHRPSRRDENAGG